MIERYFDCFERSEAEGLSESQFHHGIQSLHDAGVTRKQVSSQDSSEEP